MLLETLKTLAAEAGLDPDEAMSLDFAEFARRVAIARELRDSQRIALAVVARGPARVSPIPVWRRGHLWARPHYTTPANDRSARRWSRP